MEMKCDGEILCPSIVWYLEDQQDEKDWEVGRMNHFWIILEWMIRQWYVFYERKYELTSWLYMFF